MTLRSYGVDVQSGENLVTARDRFLERSAAGVVGMVGGQYLDIEDAGGTSAEALARVVIGSNPGAFNIDARIDADGFVFIVDRKKDMLKTSGYYHFEEPYPVKANTARLQQFKNAGAFNRFSREKFREVEELNAKLQ